MRAWLRGWAGLAGAWMLGGVLQAAPPVVTKVDPPSWWEGHSINPVRVLIRGQNLHGAQVSAPRGLKVMNATGNEAGTAVMVDLELGRDVRSGAQECDQHREFRDRKVGKRTMVRQMRHAGHWFFFAS